VAITYDPAKRDKTLQERELDFADAAEALDGRSVTFADRRRDYGEVRYRTFGLLRGRMVVVVWTPRGADRRIVSMRKANGREQKVLGQQLGAVGRDDR
jgi:uncharacterized protein